MRGAGSTCTLGTKELWSLTREPFLIGLILFAFPVSVFAGTRVLPETLHNTPIAIVAEGHSPLSERLGDVLLQPCFRSPQLVNWPVMVRRLDRGIDSFALVTPPQFERDLPAGRQPTVPLNVDATRMSQAFSGSGHLGTILERAVNAFLAEHSADKRPAPAAAVELVVRARFNPELSKV